MKALYQNGKNIADEKLDADVTRAILNGVTHGHYCEAKEDWTKDMYTVAEIRNTDDSAVDDAFRKALFNGARCAMEYINDYIPVTENELTAGTEDEPVDVPGPAHIENPYIPKAFDNRTIKDGKEYLRLGDHSSKGNIWFDAEVCEPKLMNKGCRMCGSTMHLIAKRRAYDLGPIQYFCICDKCGLQDTVTETDGWHPAD